MQTAHTHDQVKTATLPGKVIMDRVDGKHTIEMVYWGCAAEPKVTVLVKSDSELSFKLIPPLDDVMDYYNHPFAYQHETYVLTDEDYHLV